jgi:D-hydroxyproline dehydrogenase subunit gamma
MFRRSRDIRNTVSITFEGQRIKAEDGETVAAALFAAGITGFRNSPEDGSLRGPYCMIGNCFDCMVQIEGMGSRQACRERVREGLIIRRHPGLPEPEGGT